MKTKGLAGRFLNEIIKTRASYIMLLPYATIFVVFIIVPILLSVFYSITNFNMLQLPKITGLSNFITILLDDDVFTIAFINTLVFALLTGPLGYLLSFVLAWFINELTPKIRSFSVLVFYAPTLTVNSYVIWLFFFSNDSYGVLNSWLISLGLINSPIKWLADPRYNMLVVMIVLLWMSAGAGFLAFVAGLQSMNRELFEAGAIDGIRNRFQELWYITLPQMQPQLLLGAVFTISSAFSVGSVCAQLTGFPSTDYSTHTILLHIVDYAFTRFEFGYACAMQIILFSMMLIVWYMVNKFLSKWGVE